MFEETVARFLADFSFNDIYVVLNETLLAQAQELVPEIPRENYIVEPEKRDTAPAMGFVAATLYDKIPDEPIAFIPSDHYIADTTKFLRIIRMAESIIREQGKMVDIAIHPTFPSTVLGYTRVGRCLKCDEVEVYEFLGHTEKPEFEVAKKYLEDGSYLWHASYYMWTPRKILEAFSKHSPEHGKLLHEIVDALNINNQERVNSAFSQMEKISFDYAVTEKIDPSEVLIVKGDFGWSDVGAFDVLHEAQKHLMDENSNVVKANHIHHDSSDNLIYANKGKLVATIGLNDYAIIDTDDVLLICPKSKSQEVKKIVERLKNDKQDLYL